MRPQPWSSGDATDAIRKISCDQRLTLAWTVHARNRLLERELLIGDASFVLKKGFVYSEAEPSTQPGLFKYKIESHTPNSGNRIVRLVVIPDANRIWIKLVTVMWADE
jgi:hypothetical protein